MIDPNKRSVRHLGALIALAGLVGCFFHGLLYFPGHAVHFVMGTMIGDVYSMLDYRIYSLSRFAFRHFPLWNPYIFSGVPVFDGNLDLGLLYPPNWLYYVFPMNQDVNWILALHLLFAGACMYAWARRRGSSLFAALMTGTTYMFCGPFLMRAYAGHLDRFCVDAWLPALFLSIDGWIDSQKPLWCLSGIFALTMMLLAGAPQLSYYAAMIALLYALLFMRSDSRWAAGAGFAAIGIGAAGLAAVQIALGMEATREGIRSIGLAYRIASSFALPPENLATLITPFAFGDSILLPYFGRSFIWEANLFFGCAATLLAVIGIVSRPARERGRWTVLLVSILVLAVGSHISLVYDALYRFLPGYSYFRGTSKFSVFLPLFLSLHVGWGWDRINESKSSRRTLLVLALMAGIASSGLAFWINSSSQRADGRWNSFIAKLRSSHEDMYLREPDVPADFAARSGAYLSKEVRQSALIFFGVAGLAAAMEAFGGAAYALLAMLLLESLGFAWSMRITAPVPQILPYDATAEQAAGQDYRILEASPRYLDSSMTRGFRNVWGRYTFVLPRYAKFIATTQSAPYAAGIDYIELRRVPDIFRLLRLKYVFPIIQGKARREFSPLPHLLLIPHWRVVGGPDPALSAVLDSKFDPEKEVVLENAPGISSSKSKEPPGKAAVLDSRPERLDIEARLSSPAILLITDPYGIGWKAVSLSAQNPQSNYRLMPADFVIEAIPLKPGIHKLRIEYRSSRVMLGACISIIAWLVFIGFGLWVVSSVYFV